MSRLKIAIILGVVVLVLIIFISAGCKSESSCDDIEAKNAVLEKDGQDLREELENLGDDYDSIASEHEVIRQELEALKEDYQGLLQDMGEPLLKNPTWRELKRFLELDDTDENEYIADEFDCEGFALGLRDNAWRRGFRSAFVAIGFGEGNIGHALTAFDTMDKGLIYVDNTRHDAIGYLEVGKIYGTIALDGVKEQYINCDIQPGEFWQPITYVQYWGDVFAYSYYEDYTVRRQFYESCI